MFRSAMPCKQEKETLHSGQNLVLERWRRNHKGKRRAECDAACDLNVSQVHPCEVWKKVKSSHTSRTSVLFLYLLISSFFLRLKADYVSYSLLFRRPIPEKRGNYCLRKGQCWNLPKVRSKPKALTTALQHQMFEFRASVISLRVGSS